MSWESTLEPTIACRRFSLGILGNNSPEIPRLIHYFGRSSNRCSKESHEIPQSIYVYIPLSDDIIDHISYTIYHISHIISLPVVPARGGAEVALKIYKRPFSSIELACAVRQPSPCVRALCESGVLFHMSHVKLHFALHTSHSTLHTPHTPHSTLHTARFPLHTPHFTLHTPHFTLHSPHFTLHTPHFTLHTPHFTLHTPHSTLYTPHCTLHAPHFTLHTSSHLSSSHLIPAHLFSSHLFSYVI